MMVYFSWCILAARSFYIPEGGSIILGGDKLDDQFAALHENPDVIIAMPGRLLHILVEMEMKLKYIEYVVFDEADM